jgi:hypothetical protein
MIKTVRAWFGRVFPGVCPKVIKTRKGVLIIYGKGLVRQRAAVAQPSAVFATAHFDPDAGIVSRPSRERSDAKAQCDRWLTANG